MANKNGVIGKGFVDKLDDDELETLKRKPSYEEGRPYLWTMSFGWAVVGFYVRHESALKIMVAHTNHFRNAGVDYGRMAQEGPSASCEWRYEGFDQLSVPHIVKVQEYFGEVPRGRVLR